MAPMTPLQRARQNERLANEALAAGNIAAAQEYQANLTQQVASGSLPGVGNVATRVNTAVDAARQAAGLNTPVQTAPVVTTEPEQIDTPAPAAATVSPPPAFSALETIENLLRSALGVEGLGSWAVGLYNRGASATEIIQSLRYGTDGSPEGQAARARYLEAFPSMDTFIKDGTFAGDNPELQYIEYRNTLSQASQRYGISESLFTKDKIVNYLTNKVSAAELTDRMSQAAAAVSTTPAETLAILNEYYGVQNNDLISFYLDPDTTESELQKRYTAARIGTEAQRNKFNIGSSMAENLAMRGVSVDEATAGFGRARSQDAFMYGRGETASQSALINAQFGEEESKKQIERIAGSRLGQFQGGGSFATNTTGVGGLGTSATR
jgi:hypothetical protein